MIITKKTRRKQTKIKKQEESNQKLKNKRRKQTNIKKGEKKENKNNYMSSK